MNEEPTYEELRRQYELVERENERLRAHSRRKRRILSRNMKLFVLAAIILLAAPALAITLFSQTMSFVPPVQRVQALCTGTVDAVIGNMIVFTCGSGAALSVPTGASGPVNYSAISGLDTAIQDVYLLDTGAARSTSCPSSTAAGFEPVSLAITGGTATVGNSAGNLRPGHSYYYCADAASMPGAFVASITWSQ